jgi:hypothetical protein
MGRKEEEERSRETRRVGSGRGQVWEAVGADEGRYLLTQYLNLYLFKSDGSDLLCGIIS